MRILKNKLLLVAIALVILIGLFVVLKPDSSKNGQTNSTTQSSVTKTFALKITGDQITGDTSMNVNQNDTVVINLSSDADHEVHLHGYDKEVELKAGQPGKMEFTANQTGRFIVELHPSEQEIAALQVQPR